MKSYCVKEKKVTDCVPNSERYMKKKNNRLLLKCRCTSCGITKSKFVKAIKGGDIGDVFLHAGLKSLYMK